MYHRYTRNGGARAPEMWTTTSMETASVLQEGKSDIDIKTKQLEIWRKIVDKILDMAQIELWT